MKNIIIIILLFLPRIIFAQNYFDIIIDDQKSNVGINAIIENTENSYLAIGGIYSANNQSAPKLYEISSSGEVLYETDFDISKNIFFRNIFELDNEFLVIGQNTDNQSLFLLKTDNNYNVIWQKELFFFSGDTLITPIHSIINSNNELIIASSAGTDYFEDENMFTAKISLDGDLISFKYYPLQFSYQCLWDIDEIPNNNGYLISGYHFTAPPNFMRCQIVKLDNDFNITNIQNILTENYPYDYLWGNSNLTFFSDTTFLFASRKMLYSKSQDEDISIQLLDTAFNLTKETFCGKSDTVEYLPLGQSIDYVYKNSIFVGGISPITFMQSQKNWNMITKLDENQNIIWTKFYGGDALYNLYTLTATTDGGVIISGTKITESLENYDTFIFKIDADGNSSLPTEVENTSNLGKDVIVYPNPTTGIINIQKGQQIQNATIEIYDLNGKLIIKKQLLSDISTVDLANNQTGIYFYNIIIENKIIDNGKIILNK